MQHVWRHDRIVAGTLYVRLQGHKDAMVRCRPMPNGRYLWQFRKVISYADTIEEALNFVEAGAEFFDVMHRNPYG